jgi:hypothetical protein
MTVRDLAEKYTEDGHVSMLRVVKGEKIVCEITPRYYECIRDDILDNEIEKFDIVAGTYQKLIIKITLVNTKEGGEESGMLNDGGDGRKGNDA